MSSKRRVLRIALTVLVILLIAGYGAVSTFLFNPLEGGYEYDLSTLIPREVDFYVSKADLEEDFADFPELEVSEGFAESQGGAALLALPETRRLLEELGVEGALAELRSALAGLPVDVDPLTLFGGRDLAVAGFLRGADLSSADWAAYGRTSWMGKLGVELLRYPDLIGLGERGFSVNAVADDERAVGHELAGPELSRPLYVSRIRDVVIVGTSPEMLGKALQLESSRGEDSFGLSAKYGDHIASPDREGGELEFYTDYRRLAEGFALPTSFPDPRAEEFLPAFLGRLFQVPALREAMGTVDFGGGALLRLHGMLATDLLTAEQKRLYRTRGFDRRRVTGPEQVATMVPGDAGLFLFGVGNVGDLLRLAMAAAEPALVSNIDDQARSVWGYADHQPLIDDLDAAFQSRFALCLRPNDYPDEGPSGPPHDPAEVPAWAVILWVGERSKIEEVRNRVVSRQGDFGIQGHQPGSSGVFENTVQGGHKVTEYWSVFVPGTGHVATLELGDVFILSNSHQMLGHMVKTYYDGAPRFPRLAEEPFFESAVNTGLPSANLLLWLNPRAVADTTRKIARQRARDDVVIDWTVERPRIEKLVLKEKFPGETWGALSPDVEEALQLAVQPELDAFQTEFKREHSRALQKRYEERIAAAEILRGALFELSIDQKELDLLVRLAVPLD
jgi:hypothetical protein